MENKVLLPARITNVCRNSEKVVLAIQYYGSEAEISFVEITKENEDFAKAARMHIGDEVKASPCEENKVYEYCRHCWAVRLYVIVLKRLIAKFKPLVYPLL